MEKSDTKMDKIEKVYEKTTKWISDCEFYKDDLRFIQHILDRYQMEMTAHENLDEIRESTIRLQEVKYSCSSLSLRIEAYRKKFVKLIPWEITSDLKKEYVGLYDKIQTFELEFKAIKKEIFSIADHILEIEKKEKWELEFERLRNA